MPACGTKFHSQGTLTRKGVWGLGDVALVVGMVSVDGGFAVLALL
jgi:hypothetical protein